jgi:hypothetical protein
MRTHLKGPLRYRHALQIARPWPHIDERGVSVGCGVSVVSALPCQPCLQCITQTVACLGLWRLKGAKREVWLAQLHPQSLFMSTG